MSEPRLMGRNKNRISDVQNQTLFGETRVLPTDHVYTPPWVFETMAVRFDLDVCGPTGGVPWIPADHTIDEAEDGLATPWHGLVWMNPPYSNCAPWVNRWLAHGNGVALIPCSKTRWFGQLWNDPRATFKPAVMPTDPDNLSAFNFMKNNRNHRIFMVPLFAGIGDGVAAVNRLPGAAR